MCPGIADLRRGVLHHYREVAAVLIFQTHALGIFVQLAGVVGSSEKIFQEDRVRNSRRLQVLHRRSQGARVYVLIALKLDLAYLNLRAFLHYKRNAHGRRRNLPDFRTHIRKLASMLPQQSLQHHFRALHFCGIVLAFLREADLRQLEPLQNVAGCHRTDA